MVNRKYILYIEDEPELVNIIKEELENKSYKVISSDSYNDAIYKLANQRFDLIIADIQLKKGSGDMVIEHIRSDKKHFNFSTPVFLASSKITGDVVKRIGSYVDQAFVKPFDFDDLINKVSHKLSKTI